MRICVEGLDITGKTTAAQYISNQLRIPYLKVKKEVSSEGTQKEITQRIIDEMAEKLGAWSGVLDRGYLSAVASGRIYERDMAWEGIICPQNLIPDFTVLMVSSKEVALRRNKALTKQDLVVLNSTQYELVQAWLVATARPPRAVVHNLSDSLDALLSALETGVIPAIVVSSEAKPSLTHSRARRCSTRHSRSQARIPPCSRMFMHTLHIISSDKTTLLRQNSTANSMRNTSKTPGMRSPMQKPRMCEA